MDVCFDSNLDCDYDTHLKGITMSKFLKNYLKWINICRRAHLKQLDSRLKQQQKHEEQIALADYRNYLCLKDSSANSSLVRFCFALSLACRRALITACTGTANSTNPLNNRMSNLHHAQTSQQANTSASSNGGNNSNNLVNLNLSLNSSMLHNSTCLDSDFLSSFQHGYYTLFKGDVRIQNPKDEWVFNDMEILKRLMIPAVRMGLRLHQDHFQNDTSDEQSLYGNLIKFESETVISYERDPIWRHAVLNSVQSLLSLRHQFTEYSDQYKVVMLNKNYLSFRVIKLNKECVRSFWAGQQHELIFLRNKNQERGSIQNAKQVLRNIINSSCDQPIGYPIYVSPLTTSYSSVHKQIEKCIGSEFSFKCMFNVLLKCLRGIRENCTNECSGSADNNADSHHLSYSHSRPTAQNVQFLNQTETCLINLNAPPLNVQQSANPNNNDQSIYL
jgi:hypothetical protein